MITDAREERRLVQRMLAGDDDALDAFCHRFFQPLYRFALMRTGGDADLAEDVVQQTLCRAIDRAGTWRGEAQLLTWLCAICRREIAMHFRRLQRAPVQVELTEDLPEVRAALESLLTDEADPERRAARSEIRALVHVALDRLPTHYGQALEWKYLEEATMEDIAERLGSTSKAVESLLTRARHAYRDALWALLSGTAARTGTGGAR
jgi:RNA polymerase sigma-70 factor (ECF subfamily)